MKEYVYGEDKRVAITNMKEGWDAGELDARAWYFHESRPISINPMEIMRGSCIITPLGGTSGQIARNYLVSFMLNWNALIAIDKMANAIDGVCPCRQDFDIVKFFDEAWRVKTKLGTMVFMGVEA